MFAHQPAALRRRTAGALRLLCFASRTSGHDRLTSQCDLLAQEYGACFDALVCSGMYASVDATARRQHAGMPAPTHVLAVYPAAQTGNLDTASYRDSATAKPLNKAMISGFVDKLLAKPADKMDPRLDLVNAKLAGLPPVTIIGAQIDPLREDGALLEAALKKAGVKVQRKVYTGVAHEFFGMAAVVKKAADAQKVGGQALRDSFGEKRAKR